MIKKIAIIGGAGFIGHNLAIKLKANNFDVSIIDGLEVNNLTSVIGNHNKIPYPLLSKKIIENRLELLNQNNISLHVQDAREYHALTHIINTIKPDVVIHLAAVSHAERSNKTPFTTFDHSLRTLENALDASRDSIKHFIFLSSSMVYGNFKTSEVTEESVCEPIGIYGALKYAAEKIIIAYNQVFDLPYTILRPSALYGERCISRRVGQIFIENALFDKELLINGDGKEKLDFTYIEDLTDGILNIINNKNSINQIFNLTYGEGREINEMVEILKKHFPKLKLKKKDRDDLMPYRGTLSMNKAKSLLDLKSNWKLEKGYKKYIDWYIDFFTKNKKSIIL
jgi:nucleoside-diphosphate-sugar epimerase|tara:strand:+ start:1655 stop:2674 length:1020 start_codon:yes stop_codon:yes gene_type:complete